MVGVAAGRPLEIRRVTPLRAPGAGAGVAVVGASAGASPVARRRTGREAVGAVVFGCVACASGRTALQSVAPTRVPTKERSRSGRPRIVPRRGSLTIEYVWRSRLNAQRRARAPALNEPIRSRPEFAQGVSPQRVTSRIRTRAKSAANRIGAEESGRSRRRRICRRERVVRRSRVGLRP
jgi:hypothetical protein